jgi:hypothetical protein
MLIIIWGFVATIFGCASVYADPQLTASADISPQNLVAGDLVTFQFSVTNSNTADSSNLSNSLLQVSWPAMAINGVAHYFDLVSVTAPGGSVSYVFDGGGISGVAVAYALIAKGTNRTFSASFQVPNSGLVNGSIFNVTATLTWAQLPGTLTRNASATVQALPSLQASFDTIPPFTAPGGNITYRAQCDNAGSGITRKAWLVAPIPTNAAPANITIVSTNSAVWYSTLPYPIAQANSDDFIRSQFTPAFVDAQGTEHIPQSTKTIAVSLDDPNLLLMPSGVPSHKFIWRLESLNNVVGTVISQGFWFFSEDWPATQMTPQTTSIQTLPASFSIQKTATSIVLLFSGDPETNYQIERSGNLLDWFSPGPTIQTNPGVFQCLDSNPPPLKAFYRISYPAQ